MNWATFFQEEQTKPYYQDLMKFLDSEYTNKTIYPPRSELFSIFQECPYDKVKVVILGQDPYHQPNQAHGMAFSVCKGVKIPPSLRNIYKELKEDVQIDAPSHGYLKEWANQGVFLVNACMSVEANKAGSHRKIGWEIFNDHLMDVLNAHPLPLVFILWGNWAKEKARLIDTTKHLVLTAPHPSPLSAYQGFFNTKPFSKSNAFLEAHNRGCIDWSLSE